MEELLFNFEWWETNIFMGKYVGDIGKGASAVVYIALVFLVEVLVLLEGRVEGEHYMERLHKRIR